MTTDNINTPPEHKLDNSQDKLDTDHQSRLQQKNEANGCNTWLCYKRQSSCGRLLIDHGGRRALGSTTNNSNKYQH